ncbi:polysaccharide deacetylase family protein [Bdellovibrio sp. SKB1291214]|uniref:polysaccharide deacetylase family protein n=1 Tax=Bdellovibrio sp. SKB1291214 TaxID=1732569 RepID=UPI000B516AC5|nr:polysaccharide deacetylase family protein [Bdellovibrio sp. SKB1291214]UYL07379.1 polysaccharide deacetylase family protein [Bdellovibrio sp. SKB1291214]
MKRFVAMSLAVLSFNSAFAQSEGEVSKLGPVPSNEELIQMQELQTQSFKNPLTDALTWGSCTYAIRVPDKVTRGTIALTFDDGPNPQTTPIILDVLKKHDAKAVFFVLGGKIAGNENLIRRILKEGHHIANHSYNHPNFHTLSDVNAKNQIYQTDKLLRQFTTPKFLRYPYGNSTCAANEYAESIGYNIVGWNIDTCDWAFANTGTVSEKSNKTCQAPASLRSDYAGYVNHVVSQTNGGVLLMHDIHMNTAKSLDRLMTKLEQQGYRFVDLADKNIFPHLNAN